MRSQDAVAAIMRRHPPPRYAAFPEMCTAAGFDKKRRLDVWVMDTWPSSRFERICYEVKISRGDYLSEIKNPEKRRAGMLLSNRFVFAVPTGLIRIEELPYDCGLLEVAEDGGTVMRVEAPWRDTGPPPWTFVAHMATRSTDPKEGRRAGLTTELRSIEQQIGFARRQLDQLTALRRTGEASNA